MFRWPTASLWRWAILLLVVIAIPLRIHSLDRSFWLDEAWVANSLLEPDLSSVFYYDAWLQTTPPVFLLLQRLMISVLPVTEQTLRLLPCLFGLLGVGAMVYLAGRFLRPPMAFVVLFIFSFSPGHVIYSQMLKQYTSDVLVAIVLMSLGLAYLKHRTTGLLLTLTGLYVVLAGLSYNAVLFTPALLYGALFEPPGPDARLPALRIRWLHALVVSGAVAVTAMVNFSVFIKPNLDPNILGGPPDHTVLALVLYKMIDLLRLFKHFFFNLGAPWSGPWLAGLMVGAALVALYGAVHLCARSGKGMPRNLDKAAVLILPIAGALALNLLNRYPLGTARLNLFLFPAALILFGLGLQTLIARGRILAHRARFGRSWWSGSRPHTAVAVGLAVILLLRVTTGTPGEPYFTPLDTYQGLNEDAESAVSYLAEVAGPGDVLYVDTSMLEQVKFYTGLMPIEGVRLVHGAIAWPCCPRNVTLDRFDRPQEKLPSEVDRIFERSVGDTLWMIYTGRPSHWEFVGAKFPELFEQHLSERGCSQIDGPDFIGLQLDKYVCSEGAAASRSMVTRARQRSRNGAAPAAGRTVDARSAVTVD